MPERLLTMISDNGKRGWVDTLPAGASARDRAEAEVMRPDISAALREADLKPIRRADGSWKIIRRRRGTEAAADG